MASAIMNQIVTNKHGKQIWQIESAGTWGREGFQVVDEVQIIMRNRGIDLSDHRSRIVSKELMQSSDLVLTMEKGHKEALRMEFPSFSDRIFLLSEMVGQDFEIDDPIGKPMRYYEQTAKQLETILLEGFEKITKLAEESIQPSESL
jgi:protein-tyrosine-phosphatase